MKMKLSTLKKLIREQIQSNEFENLSEDEKITIIAQFEAIRNSGQFNMFDFYSVQRAAHENQFYELVSFTENNRNKYSQILKGYEKYIDKIENTPKYRKLVTKYSLE